jgi:Leucine-rich repeat (LRR) protein
MKQAKLEQIIEQTRVNRTPKLTLHDNEISNLPPSIGNLTNLVYLNLRNNQLIVLPNEIGKLSSLDWLSLDCNHLIRLPDNI